MISMNSRRKLAGGFLSVGIIRLLSAIILQFVTLKFFERRMILWQMELLSGLMTTKALDS
jgi:hypothetical protein